MNRPGGSADPGPSDTNGDAEAGDRFDASTESWIGEDAQEPEQVARNTMRVKRGFMAKFKRVARRIPFSRDLLAAYYCAFDPATPARVRATLLGALAYFVLPLDSIPDFLLGFGFTDDATVLMAALSVVAAHVTDRHRQAAEDALAETLEAVPEDIATDSDGEPRT